MFGMSLIAVLMFIGHFNYKQDDTLVDCGI
jgi:hypothetical protein